MKILGQEIQAGETKHLKIDIAKLHTRTSIDIPVIVSRGKTPGPCLLLIGGIHGDEINGVEIVRQAVTKKYHLADSGTIISIPLVNVFGFINQTREFPDGRDLNRAFPGSKTGSLASRFAYHLMQEIIPHIDYCIDFHTGGALRYNIPHLRFKAEDEETLKLAKTFGTPFIQYAPNREKTFRNAMVKKGKKVLLFEGGKSLNINAGVTQIGLRGILAVQQDLGINDWTKELDTYPPKAASIIIENSKWIRAKHSGIFREFFTAGQAVKKNDILGSISDPYGDFERKIKSPLNGYLLNVNHSPLVNQGNALFHIGF